MFPMNTGSVGNDPSLSPPSSLDEDVSRGVSTHLNVGIGMNDIGIDYRHRNTSDAPSAASSSLSPSINPKQHPNPNERNSSNSVSVSGGNGGSDRKYSFDSDNDGTLHNLDSRRFQLTPFNAQSTLSSSTTSLSSLTNSNGGGNKKGHSRGDSTFIDITPPSSQHPPSDSKRHKAIVGLDEDDDDNDDFNSPPAHENPKVPPSSSSSRPSNPLGIRNDPYVSPTISLTGETLPSSLTADDRERDRPLPPPPRVRPVTHIVFEAPHDMYTHDPGYTRHHGHSPAFLAPHTPGTDKTTSGSVGGNRSAPSSPAHHRRGDGNHSNNNSRGSPANSMTSIAIVSPPSTIRSINSSTARGSPTITPSTSLHNTSTQPSSSSSSSSSISSQSSSSSGGHPHNGSYIGSRPLLLELGPTMSGFLAVPEDAIFTILSMLDSRALCSIAGVDRAFNAMTNAETEVWRSRAHGDPSINISARKNLTRSLTPREDYLKCLHRHALAKQGHEAELVRQRDEATRSRISLTARLTFHLLHEAVFVVLIPLLILIFAILLAVASQDSLWISFIPLWAMTILIIWAAYTMQRYRKSGLEHSRSVCQAIMEQTTMKLPFVLLLSSIAILGLLLLHLGSSGSIDWPLSARLSPTFVLALLFAIKLFVRIWRYDPHNHLSVGLSRLRNGSFFLFFASPFALFLGLLAAKLDDALDISMVNVFIPLFVATIFLFLFFVSICLSYGCGIRCERCRIVRDDGNHIDRRLGFTFGMLMTTVAAVLLFEIFIALSYDNMINLTQSQLISPLIAGMSSLTLVSIMIGVNERAHRLTLYHQQLTIISNHERKLIAITKQRLQPIT